MEGVSSRLGRASSRYGGSAPVFTGPVRKWKKQWVQVSSPISHSRSHNHHNNSPSLLLCRWTPVSTTDNSVKPEEEFPRRKFRYTPIVIVDEMKKEVDKRATNEAVTSKAFQSSPTETAKNDGIFRKQDIDSLFMEVSQASKNDQDDNSDGNNNYISTILRSNFKPYGRDFDYGQPTGRFSNGRIVTDFISEGFQLKPTIPAYLDTNYGIADFASGVCFASAGTGYDDATSNVLSVMPLRKELEYYKEYQKRLRDYLGEEKAEKIICESLYLISMGTNDFLENYYILPYRSSQYSIDGYQHFLAGIARNFIQELYHLGARKMSLGGLPPMGCLPLERATRLLSGSDCLEDYNNVARNFNVKLHDLVNNLNNELSGIQLVLSSPYEMLLEIIQKPYSFGFESTAKACCASGMFEMSYLCNSFNPLTCEDADKYVFWDSFHPTQKTNWILAQHAINNSLAVFR